MPKNIASFNSLYWPLILHPAQTFKLLVNHPSQVSFGIKALLIPAIGYTLFYIMAYTSGGAPSTFKPWLALPIDKYYFYDIFLTLPAYFISFLSSGGLIYLLAKKFGGQGTFDQTLSVLGISIGVASLSAMAHDLTDGF